MTELSWEEVEEMASEDPDDRLIRLAHGFPFGADEAAVCVRCGLTYFEISGGKIRRCSADEVGG